MSYTLDTSLGEVELTPTRGDHLVASGTLRVNSVELDVRFEVGLENREWKPGHLHASRTSYDYGRSYHANEPSWAAQKKIRDVLGAALLRWIAQNPDAMACGQAGWLHREIERLNSKIAEAESELVARRQEKDHLREELEGLNPSQGESTL